MQRLPRLASIYIELARPGFDVAQGACSERIDFSLKEVLDARDFDKGVVRSRTVYFHQWRFDFKCGDNCIDVLRQ
jgi:hypothetical protein